MYGDLGNKLVQHAKRTQSLANLPPYQTELVRNIVREVRGLDISVTNQLAPFGGSFNPVAEPATACALLVEYVSIRRNKRCLLAYHRVRAEKVQEKIWKGIDVLEGSGGGSGGGRGEGGRGEEAAAAEEDGHGTETHGEAALSPEEEEYARGYAELLAAYKGRWTDIDLTGSLEPPRDLFVDVRVLKDAGEIQTEYGAINLTKNSQLYVRRGDVERLIAQGYLQRLG